MVLVNDPLAEAKERSSVYRKQQQRLTDFVTQRVYTQIYFSEKTEREVDLIVVGSEVWLAYRTLYGGILQDGAYHYDHDGKATLLGVRMIEAHREYDPISVRVYTEMKQV